MCPPALAAEVVAVLLAVTNRVVRLTETAYVHGVPLIVILQLDLPLVRWVNAPLLLSSFRLSGGSAFSILEFLVQGNLDGLGSLGSLVQGRFLRFNLSQGSIALCFLVLVPTPMVIVFL